MKESKTVHISGIGEVLLEKNIRARHFSITVRPFKGVRLAVPYGASFKAAQRVVKNKIVFFFSIFLAAALFTHCSPVYADISPDAVEVTTLVYTPEPGTFDPRFGKYEYKVSWQRIPAGNFTLDLRQNQGKYRSQASARTNRFVDFFYKVRFNTAALVAADTLYPKNSVYKRKDN
ncbi:MAG: DUF3108 domain-containing protein [Desulfobacterales bacterium]